MNSFDTKPCFVAIVVAGGTGSRMNSIVPKPLLPLADGVPVVLWSARTLGALEAIDSVVLVVPQAAQTEFATAVQSLPEVLQQKIFLVSGGATRKESVRYGLEALRAAQPETRSTYVLIHDAARPFVSKSLVSAVLAAVVTHNAVTVAVPVVDSIKHVGQDSTVIASLDRSVLQAVQTPQAFAFDLIWQAHNAVDADASDDAALVEQFHSVSVVSGSRSNFKITTPEDYEYACYLSEKLTGISNPS